MAVKRIPIVIVSRSARRFPEIGGAPRLSMDYARIVAENFNETFKVYFVGQYKPKSSSGQVNFIKVSNRFGVESKHKLFYLFKAFLLDVKITLKTISFIGLTKNIGVVHVNSNISAILIRILRRRMPIVYTVHDSTSNGRNLTTNFFENIARMINNKLFESLAVRVADCVIAVSPHIKRQLSASKKVTLLFPYPSVLSAKEKMIPLKDDHSFLQKYGLTPNKFILTVGHQDGRKRFDSVIRALNLIENKNLILVIIGRGKENINLRSLCDELGINSRIRFLENVADSDLLRFYRLSVMFVLASHSEGFPIAVVESACSGTPSLLFLEDGISMMESIDKGFIQVYNSIDPNTIANRINLLLREIEMSENMSREIAYWAKEAFGINEYAKNLQTLYNRVMDGKRRI